MAALKTQLPHWSPDGNSIAYIRDGKQLHLLTLATLKAAKSDKVVATGALERDSALAWSPDSQWIAFTLLDPRSFNNIHVVAASGGEVHPITFLANGETGNRIAWSPDGRYILFDTAQRSEQVQIARVDLLPHVPKYREDRVSRAIPSVKDAGYHAISHPATPEHPSNDPADPDRVTPAPPASQPRLRAPRATPPPKRPRGEKEA